jgi:hypothetical protein
VPGQFDRNCACPDKCGVAQRHTIRRCNLRTTDCVEACRRHSNQSWAPVAHPPGRRPSPRRLAQARPLFCGPSRDACRAAAVGSTQPSRAAHSSKGTQRFHSETAAQAYREVELVEGTDGMEEHGMPDAQRDRDHGSPLDSDLRSHGHAPGRHPVPSHRLR